MVLQVANSLPTDGANRSPPAGGGHLVCVSYAMLTYRLEGITFSGANVFSKKSFISILVFYWPAMVDDTTTCLLVQDL